MANSKRMNASYIPPDDISSIDRHLIKFGRDPEIKSVLFFMAYDERYSESSLSPVLQKTVIPIIGGVFPELIFMGERKNKGVVLLPLPFELKTQLFELSQTPADFIKQIEMMQKDSRDESSSLFVFTDALSENKDVFIDSLFNYFGINSTYIGGGAGSLCFTQFPCIISNSGLNLNSAVIGWTNKKIVLGVAHGWQPVSPALKVTKTLQNKIISINWKPAFEVYREIVESHSGLTFTEDNFFSIAKSYPLGITKIDAEMVVRDPFMKNENSLYLIDNVNEGEYVKILHGNMNSLLEGASNAKEIALSQLEDSMDKNSVFCIDCISRVLYMQDDFKKELEVINHHVNVTGILSIGEIANSKDSFLEIYNKTIVIGIW